jgi:hypothetical protein
MCRMRADSHSRAVPERLVEEEKASGVSDGERGSTWAKVSRAQALDVGSNFDHSVDSCFLVFRAITFAWCKQTRQPMGSRVWRSRYRGAREPVRPETLRRHLSVVLPLSKSRRAEDASLCQPSGVMNLSLSSNGHVSLREQHGSGSSLNPLSAEFVKSQRARALNAHTYIYVCRADTHRPGMLSPAALAYTCKIR